MIDAFPLVVNQIAVYKFIFRCNLAYALLAFKRADKLRQRNLVIYTAPRFGRFGCNTNYVCQFQGTLYDVTVIEVPVEVRVVYGIFYANSGYDWFLPALGVGYEIIHPQSCQAHFHAVMHTETFRAREQGVCVFLVGKIQLLGFCLMVPAPYIAVYRPYVSNIVYASRRDFNGGFAAVLVIHDNSVRLFMEVQNTVDVGIF